MSVISETRDSDSVIGLLRLLAHSYSSHYFLFSIPICAYVYAYYFVHDWLLEFTAASNMRITSLIGSSFTGYAGVALTDLRRCNSLHRFR